MRTKFAQHTTRGRAVVGAVAEIMAEVNAESVALQRELGTQKKELWDRCDFTEKQLELMTLEMKEKIHLITEDVEYKVRAAPRLHAGASQDLNLLYPLTTGDILI